jgi:hypothetical protein
MVTHIVLIKKIQIYKIKKIIIKILFKRSNNKKTKGWPPNWGVLEPPPALPQPLDLLGDPGLTFSKNSESNKK